MQIEIYSDVVCPWCFVGKRRLERALETAGYAQQTHIAWRPFQLNPTMPKEGMDRRVYLDAKFGGAEARRAIEERVAKAGEADGIGLCLRSDRADAEYLRCPSPHLVRRTTGLSG